MNDIKIDINKLRRDLIDYFGTAMFNGFPMSMMELEEVKRASDEELLEIAYKNSFNLNDYVYEVKLYSR